MRKLFITTLVVMAMTIMCVVPAFALTTEEEEWLEKNIVTANDSGVVGNSAWMNNWLVTDSDKSDTAVPVTTIDGVPVYIASGKTEEALANQIQTQINNSKTVDNVTNITDGLNIKADTEGAARLLSGFTSILNLAIGVIVTLITLGMALYSAFDIGYIAFPVFRVKCEEAKMTGGNNVYTKTTANGETKLRFVTDDAQYAIKQGSVESGANPWTIYFKKRIISYIMLAIILFILLTGNISLITNIALKMVSGIMDVLGGLA